MSQLLLRFEVDVNVSDDVDVTPLLESDDLTKLITNLQNAIEPAVRTEMLDSLSKSKFIALAAGLTISIGTA